ncbi:hypothetical protein FQN54_000540 [Arachnomyces sp. PD_36]|nr:hypothetical protein FQN54_000540 [Arachnomyces sp. PD_36]
MPPRRDRIQAGSQLKWEAHRDELRDLYLTLNMSTGEIVKFMNREHNFQATEHEYEIRFREWNLRKNLNREERKFVYHRVTKRTQMGKKSLVKLRGREPFSEAKLKKEMSRNRPSTYEIYQQANGLVPEPSSPKDLSVYTPPSIEPYKVRTDNLPCFQFHDFLDSRAPLPCKVSRETTWPPLAALFSTRTEDDKPDSVSKTVSHLRTTSIERNDGGHRETLQMMLKTPESALLQFMKYAACLSSNNMLGDRQADAFLKRITTILDDTVLETFFSVRIPTIEAFATNLVASAVRIENERILTILLKAGADLGRAKSHLQSYSRSALRIAIEKGNINLVKMLLAAGVDVNGQFGFPPSTPLGLAIRNGNTELSRLLLDEGADPNSRTYDTLGGTVLLAAVLLGNIELVQLLLDRGAHINNSGPNRRAVLQAAARTGNFQLVDLLVRSGADINAPAGFNSGRTALQAAVETNNIDLVRLLLEAGADINAPAGFNSGRTALQAAVETNHIDLVRFLLRAGADVNAPASAEKGLTALQAARNSGNVEMTQLILASGAYTSASETAPNEAMVSGHLVHPDTARILLLSDRWAYADVADKSICRLICTVARSRDISLLRYLLNNHADVLTSTGPKDAAFIESVTNGDIGMAELLLDAGADVNARDGQLETPLQQAVLKISIAQDKARDFDLIHFLLVRGADINAPPGDVELSKTALQTAAYYGHIELVQLLLRHGANVNAPGNSLDGSTALQYAVGARDKHRKRLEQGEVIELVELLLDSGADVNAVACMYGRTALQIAAELGPVELVQLLLSRGADAGTPGRPGYGRTALQMAAYHGSIDTVQLLLDAGADVNAPPSSLGGWTALQAAATAGKTGIALALLQAGADVHAAGAEEEGRTALEAAAEHGRLDMVRLLLNAAEPDTDSLRIAEAIDFAEYEGHRVLARDLRDYQRERNFGDVLDTGFEY